MNVSVLKQRKLLIRLFFNTYEYKNKLIYKSLATLSCRNFYSILLPEQRRWRSLFLTVAPEVQVFSDTAGVVAGGGRGVQLESSPTDVKAPQDFTIFLQEKRSLILHTSYKSPNAGSV